METINYLKRLAVLFIIVAFTLPTKAQTTYTWTGTTSTDWNTAGNWTPAGGPPTATDNVIIVSAANIPNLGNAARTVNDFTMTSGTLHLSNGANTARNLTINGENVAIRAGTIFQFGTNGGTLNITGATDLVIGDVGSVSILRTANITSNGFNINDCTFGLVTTINNTAASGTSNFTGTTSFGSNLTLINQNAGNISFANALSVSGNTNIDNQGAGTITIPNGNTFTGTSAIINSAGGDLTIGTSTFGGTTTLTNSGSGTFTSNTNTFSGTTNINNTNSGTFNVNGNSNFTVLATNAATFTNSGSGTMDINGDNSFSRDMRIINSGSGNLNLNGDNTITRDLNITDNSGTMTANGDLDVTRNTVISSSGTFNLSSTGSFTPTGTFEFTNDGTVSFIGSSTFTNTFTFTHNAAATLAVNWPFTYNTDFIFNNNSNSAVTFPSAHTYNGIFIYNNANSTITFTGGNTFDAGDAYFYNNGNGNITLANTTSDIFNFGGIARFFNLGSGTISVARSDASLPTTFDRNISVRNQGTGIIRFCQNNGRVELLSGRTISASVFTSGTLIIRNFTKIAPTAVSLNLDNAGSGFVQISNSTFGSNTTIDAPRITLDRVTFDGSATITKRGAGNDASIGGNIFGNGLNINNHGSGYIRFANTRGDTITNGSLSTRIYGTGNIHVGYTGVTVISVGSLNARQTPGATGQTLFGRNAVGNELRLVNGTVNISSTLEGGTLVLNNVKQLNAAAGTNTMTGGVTPPANLITFGVGNEFNRNVLARANGILLTGSTFNMAASFTKEGNTNNDGTGNNTFNGVLTITHNGTAGRIRLYGANNDTYNNNIIVEAPNGGTIEFGGAGVGIGTLAATRTLTVGAGGFVDGNLVLRNFVQTGATNQTLNMTGTAGVLTLGPGTEFGANIDFTAPGILLNGVEVAGDATLTKLANTNNDGIGNNIFNGNLTIHNNGTGRFQTYGAGTDSYVGNLEINNSGGGSIRFGTVGGSSTLNGDMSIGTGGFATGTLTLRSFNQTNANLQILDLTGTSLLDLYESSFNGQVDFTAGGLALRSNSFNNGGSIEKSGAGNNSTYGDNTYVGNFSIINSSNATLRLSNNIGETFLGNINFRNTGTSGTLQIAFNDATGTEFNGNVILESTSTGLTSFGANTGTSTITMGNNIQIGGGGFIAGTLTIRNLTQNGTVANNLNITSTGLVTFGTDTEIGGNLTISTGGNLLLNTSTFNGDVNINTSGIVTLTDNIFNEEVVSVSGRIFVNGGNTFEKDADFTKNGATADVSTGGNTYKGNLTLTNSSANLLTIYNTLNDTYEGNITLNSSNTGGIAIGSTNAGTGSMSAGNSIIMGTYTDGPLFIRNFTQSGTTAISLSTLANSLITLGPNNTFGGNFTSNSFGILLNGNIFNGTNNITKTGAGANTSIGNNTYNGILTLTSETGSGSLTMYSSGNDSYSEDVFINCNNGGGFIFGTAAGGTGTFAAGKTIIIGGGGFNCAGSPLTIRDVNIENDLNLTLTGTLTLGPNLEIDGELTVISPRVIINGVEVSGNANIEKTGGSNDDGTGSANIFNGDVTITNSGTARLRFGGTGNTDEYLGTATFIRTGTGGLEPSYNSSSEFHGDITTVGSTGGIVYMAGGANGAVTFVGTDDRDISSDVGGNPLRIRDLTLNSPGAKSTLSGRLEVGTTAGGNFGTVAGYIVSQGLDNLFIVMDETVTVGAGSVDCYINGPMSYRKNSTGSSTLTFPVGKINDYRRIDLNVEHGNTTTYNYIYELADHSAKELGYTLAPTIDSVSGVRYWSIRRWNSNYTTETDANLIGATVTIHYGANDFVTDPANLTVVKNNETSPTVWTDIGGTAVGSPSGLITSGTFTAFSNFTLGNLLGGLNPLPVNFSNISATCINNSVDVEWTTTSEQNNAYFEVERSEDGTTWTSLVQILGAGTSFSEINYSYNDNIPVYGAAVYRIKQTDYDGKSEFSKAVVATCGQGIEGAGSNGLSENVLLYPNPNNGTFQIKGFGDVAEITVVNTLGASVFKTSVTNNQTVLNLNNLANGSYSVSISNGADKIVKRITIIK